MKKNLWPIGITVFLLLFVAAVVIGGIMISRINYDLVHQDYYAHEIGYEDHLESMRRADALDAKPKVQVDGRVIVISCPEGFSRKASAFKAHLYYAADKAQDLHAEINISQGETVRIPLEQRPGGNWRVTLEWIQDGQIHRTTAQERVPHP